MAKQVDRRAALSALACLPAFGYQEGSGATSREVTELVANWINVRELGASGTGIAEETVAFQRALDSIPETGGVVFVPPGTYKLKSIAPRPHTTILLSSGAVLLAMRSSDNQLFALRNEIRASERLDSAIAGRTSVQVSNTTAFRSGDRIIVSAGTFSGSGVEEGPIEFNTIRSIESARIMSLEKPLQYSYSSFGIPQAAPRVQSLGPAAKTLRNIRISGGVLRPFADFNSIYFNFASVEDIEIDHVRMEGVGGGIATGHNVSNLNFHDNIAAGDGQAEGQGIDIASVVESIFANNVFNINNDHNPRGQYNHMVLEVACRDNLITGNTIGPIRNARTGGIDLTFYSFGNRIVNNRIWGCDEDVRAGEPTLGIRTFANGIDARHPGNLIIGNKITDIMQAIGDGHESSVIMGNMVVNSTRHAKSVGINCGDDRNTSPYLGNSFVNMSADVKLNNGSVGGFALLSGRSPPQNQGGEGSIYLRGQAQPGESLWRRERTEGILGWMPEYRLSSGAFAELPNDAMNGTLLYVTDGVAGSSPLKDGGSGCVAVREHGKWRGL